MEYTITKAASSDLRTCEQIMRRIYEENPAHWPYGLTTDQLRGNLYMVREASSMEPVGFVGWQEYREGMCKVGYYSIGILPEYRQRSFAKSAVRQIIEAKSAGVDEVRALIHCTNHPSLQLAESLDVPVEKIAGFGGAVGGTLGGAVLGAIPGIIMQHQDSKDYDPFWRRPDAASHPLAEVLGPASLLYDFVTGGERNFRAQSQQNAKITSTGSLLGALLGGTAGHKLQQRFSSPEEDGEELEKDAHAKQAAKPGAKLTALQTLYNWGAPIATGGGLAYGWDQAGYGADAEMTPTRIMNMLKNFGVGALAGTTALPRFKGTAKTPPKWTKPTVKNVQTGVTEGLLLPPVLGTFLEAPGALAKYKSGESDQLGKLLMGLLPILGVGGLGLAGYKALKKEDPQEITINQPPQPGRVRVTLPTKNPGDQETQVELPFDADAIQLSHALQGTLSRDVRRRLLDEAKHRKVPKGRRRLNTASDPARLKITPAHI